MKNKLTQLQKPLMNISKMFDKFSIHLLFTTEKRNFASDPEDVQDMVSCYPSAQYYDIVHRATQTSLTNNTDSLLSAILDSDREYKGASIVRETILVDDNNEEDILAQDLHDLIREYKEISVAYRDNGSLLVAIDETYLDTIIPKISVIDDINVRVAQDIVPCIISYITTFNKAVPKLREIVYSSVRFESLQDISNETRQYGRTYKRGAFFAKTLCVDNHNNTNANTYKHNHIMADALLSLYFMESINILNKGKDEKFIRDFKVNINAIIEVASTEHVLCKSLNLEALGTSIFGSHTGSVYTNLCKLIMDIGNSFMDIPYPLLKNDIIDFTTMGVDDADLAERSRRIITNMNGILKYAENSEILSALCNNKKEAVRMFSEGFSSTSDDNKDLAKVIDLSRRASLAEVELEFINTKYSKKDAINQAYVVVQEALTLRGKIHSKNAIEMIDQIISNLQGKIQEVRKTDHKRERMSINIAYPAGYEG